MDTVDGEAIRRLRRVRGMTMRELATAAGIDHAVVSRLERQVQGDVSASALVKIVRALGVPIDAVLSEWLKGDVPLPIAELAIEVANLGNLSDQQQRYIATILHAHKAAIADAADQRDGKDGGAQALIAPPIP